MVIKRTLAVILFVALFFSFGSEIPFGDCGSISAYAADLGTFPRKERVYDKSGKYGFAEFEDGYILVDYTDHYSKVLRVPSTFRGKKVVAAELSFAVEESEVDVKAVIPASVTKIGNAVSSNIKSIKVSKKNKVYSSKDGVLYNKKQTRLLWYPEQKKDDEFTVPDSVKVIGESSIHNFNLKKIKLGKNVRIIDKEAIYLCTNLKKVKLNKGLEKIRAYGIFANIRLKTLSVPKSVGKLGKYSIGARYYPSGDARYDRKNFVVKCRKNSVAHKFATKHKIQYKLVK